MGDSGKAGKTKKLWIKQLEEAITEHRELYEAGKPKISDSQFDALVDKLQKLDPSSSVLQKVGSTLEASNKVKHKKVMLSLAKTKSLDEVMAWAKETGASHFLVMPKFDGVALSIVYQDGRLQHAVTRGDGKIGDDVTRVARHFIPQKVSWNGRTEIRGEVIFSRDTWASVEDHFNKNAKKPSNARNAAAGTLKRKSINANIAQKLMFIPYDVLGGREMELSEALDSTPGLQTYSIATLKTLEEEIQRQVQLVKSSDYPFETDGLVVKVNAYDDRDALGETSHHPRWAMALKHEDEEAATGIVNIEWQVSRQGIITPVAILKPVLCGGVTISRATLHHAGNVLKLKPKTGTRVAITRRGGVIPHVERVTFQPPNGTRLKPPIVCPCCLYKTEMRGEDFLYCTNDECPDMMRGRLLYWCQQTDMMGFGEKIVYDLYQEGIAWQPSDFYTLDKDVMIEMFGKGLGPKLIKEAAEKSKMPPAVLFTALGIDGIGKTQAEKLFESISFDDLMHHFINDDDEYIVSKLPEGFGPVLIKNLFGGLKANLGIIQSLVDVVEIVKPAKSSVTKGPFAGKKVVFTGALADMQREFAQEQVRIFGGTTPGSLTKDTDFLVVGSRASPEQLHKRNKATAYNTKGGNIKVIEEEDFLEMIVEATQAIEGDE